MQEELTSLSQMYPEVPESEADAHAWVFREPYKIEKYFCKFPQVKENEVRMRVLYTGLCHSDALHSGDEWGICLRPSCPGHEIIGEITHIGDGVNDRKIGDIVAAGPQRNMCRECEYCKSGNNQICTGMPFRKRDIYGEGFGGYCTALQLCADLTFPVPEGLDITTSPPLLCAGATVFSPLRRYCEEGQTVGVLGIGGLGHLGVQYAHKMGCRVVAFTRSESKVESIKALGADEVIVVDPDYAALKAHSKSLDAILNTLPVSDSKILNHYIALLKPRGTLLQVGLPNVDVPMEFSFFSLIANEITVVGSYIGGVSMTQETLEFSAAHDIKVQTESFSFEEFPQAFDRMSKGKAFYRCVVNVADYCKEKGL